MRPERKASSSRQLCQDCRRALGDNGPLLNPNRQADFLLYPQAAALLGTVKRYDLDPIEPLNLELNDQVAAALKKMPPHELAQFQPPKLVDVIKSAIAATRSYEMDANRLSAALPVIERAYDRLMLIQAKLIRQQKIVSYEIEKANLGKVREFVTDATVALEALKEHMELQMQHSQERQ